MTRKARNPVSYSKYSKERYVAKNSKYRPDQNKAAYHIIPENYPKIVGSGDNRHSNAPYPEGLVDISGITGPVQRRITPSYLDRLFKGKSTVSDRQNYINKVISNPRSPTENVRTALQYVRDNPFMFTPEPSSPYYSDDINRMIEAHNGNDPEPSFVSRLYAMFPWIWRKD